MEETKPQGVLAKLDAALPRMWKEWLISAALIIVLLFVVGAVVGGAQSAVDRVGVILAKLPLLTLGGLLGYYGDRGLFPYARPGDILDQLKAANEAFLTRIDEDPNTAATLASLTSLRHSFDIASIRRAIIVAACILGAALGA